MRFAVGQQSGQILARGQCLHRVVVACCRKNGQRLAYEGLSFGIAPLHGQNLSEAEAAAQTFSVNVTQGNANIGFTYGQSLANYRDTTGTADAKALDLGGLPPLCGVAQWTQCTFTSARAWTTVPGWTWIVGP